MVALRARATAANVATWMNKLIQRDMHSHKYTHPKKSTCQAQQEGNGCIDPVITAVCHRDLPPVTVHPQRRCPPPRDWVTFTTLWMSLFIHVAAFAAVARALSATMDYIGGGRTNYWIQTNMGPLPDFLGGALPDFVAIAIIVVPSLLFVCGMEDSEELRFVLNITVAATVAFFLIVGGLHLDVTNWTQTDVLPGGISAVLSGAALCSFGFICLIKPAPHLPPGNKTINGALWGIVIAAYCFIGIIVTLMAHYSVLSGSVVPLIEVFETRDVDWARIVMATLSTIALSLALLEVMSPVHSALLTLAGGRWRLLPRNLTEEHPLTATPVSVITITCVVASVLACLVPLRTLIQLISAGTLVDNAFTAMVLLHRRYLPITEQENDDVKYQPLRREESTLSNIHTYHDAEPNHRQTRTVHCLKTGLNFLPNSLQHNSKSPEDYANLMSPNTSESAVTVTYMDPDNISLVQNKLRTNSCFSNGTIATSLSSDSISEANLLNGSNPSFYADDTSKLDRNLKSEYKDKICLDETNSKENRIRRVSFQDDSRKKNFKEMNNFRSDSISLEENTSIGINNLNKEDVLPIENTVQFSERARLLSKSSTQDEIIECDNKGDEGKMVEDRDGDDACVSLTDSSSSEEEEVVEESDCTDIDALFEEYKKNMMMQRRFIFTPIYQPTATSSRRVTCALIGLAVSVLLSCASYLVDISSDTSTICAAVGVTMALVLLIVITREPHNRQSALWLPLVPAVSYVASTVLVLQISADIWPITVSWVIAGCLLYWYKTSSHQWRQRAGFTATHRDRERVLLNAPPRHSIVSTLVPSHGRCLTTDYDRRLTRVDTLLVAR